MTYRCHGCGATLGEADRPSLDLEGGTYQTRGEQFTNGERDVILVGPRHLVAPTTDARAVAGYWCGPVESVEVA